MIVNPSGEIELEPGDEVIVIGAPADISRLFLLFHQENPPEN
jgi:Trk K+ transport system NAD-binding subunit